MNMSKRINSLSELMSEGAEHILLNLDLSLIDLDPTQPRKTITPDALDELAATIKDKGIMQPITVRSTNDRYTVIFGERRFRAAKIAGLATIPALLRDHTPQEVLVLQLIENSQREDVKPMEEAHAIKRLVDELGKGGSRQAAELLGKSEAFISQRLALLELPPIAAAMVEDGKIKDADAAVTVGKLEKRDPAKAQALADSVKTGEALTRTVAREALKDEKEAKEAKPKAK